MGRLYHQALRANDWDHWDYTYRDDVIKTAQIQSLVDQRACAANRACLRGYYNRQIIYLLGMMRVIDGIDPERDITNALLEVAAHLNDAQDLRSLAVDDESHRVVAFGQ